MSRRTVALAEKLGSVVAFALALSLAIGGNLPAFGQAQAIQLRVDPRNQGGQGAGVQPPTDRVLSRGMQRAQASIAAGEFSQAIRFLDEVLARGEDQFVEIGDQGEYAGMKETARRLLRDLPPAGRQAYEVAFGAAGKRMLATAIDRGDPKLLTDVAQRYFHTPAGYEAALLLAMDEADAGRHFTAALAYDQLLDAPDAVRRFDPALSLRAATSWLAAGDEVRARRILDALLERSGQSVEIAGRVRKLGPQADPIEWLRQVVGEPTGVETQQERQWLTYRGNAARNGSVKGGLPHLRVRWEVPLLGPPKLETLFENLAANLIRSELSVPIASNVIAAGDYILTRTPQGLLAVDFETGKRVWRSEPQRDEVLEQLVQSASNGEDQAANPEPLRAFARRLWEDYLYGVVSSDGERVYMVNNLRMPLSQQYEIAPFMGGEVQQQGATNKLSAYELASQGKLVWEIDGERSEGELAGMFFLGAPLPVAQSLYVLGESAGAVYLLALDRKTGAVEWRQQLARLETSVQIDLRRRLQSISPAYEAGIVVCPTGAGAVMGVDLAKRSFAWAYRFDALSLVESISRMRDEHAGGFRNRWIENACSIADGKVVLTPPESDFIHCVDLQTGKLLWKARRDEMNRVACIQAGRVLLIGNKKLMAFNLQDGTPAWKKPLDLLGAETPSGTGFLSDGRYYLPLSSSEVAAIDVSEGRIVARTSPRDEAPLGSLICHRGSVISQNGEYLDCYDQIDALRARSKRQLEQEPNNVEALRTLGEVAYNEERWSDALTLLERAYQVAPEDVETREVLAECLATALDADFLTYRQKLPLLKDLEDGGLARRIQILRIESQGMLQAGEIDAAAECCFQLYRLGLSPDEMIANGHEHEATVSRWAASQLAAIWQRASEAERASLRSLIEAEADRLGAEPRSESLENFLAYFGALPTTERLRLRRARELALAGQGLEAQQQLLDLETSSDDVIRREAIGRIAWQLHEAGLHTLAYQYDAELAGPLADELLFDDVTGGSIVSRWKTPADDDPRHWPRGRVKTLLEPTGPTMGSRTRMAMLPVRMERNDSILGLSTAQLSLRGGELVLADNFGREYFRTSAESEGHGMYRHPGSVYGASRGNLLVVSLGRQLVALNTLTPADAMAPSVLWRSNLVTNLSYDQPFSADLSGGADGRPGTLRAGRQVSEKGTRLGVIGPMTSRGVIFQDQRRLVCVDPISGGVAWSRTDVPQGCELFGDAELLFALAPDEPEARVYSSLDGRFLGRRATPPLREQAITIGREVISWSTAGDESTLRSTNAWTGEEVWEHRFTSGSTIDVEMGRYIAVADSDGAVAIVDGETGEKLIEYQAPDAERVDELHLRVGRDEFLLLLRGPQKMNRGAIVQGLSLSDSPVISGRICLFDRTTGKLRWNRPVEVERQAYPMNQPIDMPFLLFAGVLSRDSNGAPPKSTLFAIDKATGRTIYRDAFQGNNGGQCIVRIADPTKQQAAIEMAGRTILLQFTDLPRPPEPPSMAEVENREKTTSGLMGIILKLGLD
jgi:outer membrane protein assembly factor BamB